VEYVLVDEGAWLPEKAWKALRQCLKAGGTLRIYSTPKLQKYLDEYQLWFNNYRPHQAIGGLTPNDFYNGKTHPEPISIAELKQKKLKRITFADGLLATYQLVDIKKAA
jgi:hypothetical protein